MLLLLHVFLWITHRPLGEDRKSIISEGPKATLFSSPGEIFLLLLHSISLFLQRDWETWLCLRSLIALEVIPALWSFLPEKASQLVSWVRQQKITQHKSMRLLLCHPDDGPGLAGHRTVAKDTTSLLCSSSWVLSVKFFPKLSEYPGPPLPALPDVPFGPSLPSGLLAAEFQTTGCELGLRSTQPTKGLWARSGSYSNTVQQYTSPVPLLTRCFSKTLEQRGL